MFEIAWYWWMIWLVVFYVAMSVDYLKPGEIAAVYFLGREIDNEDSWIPPFYEEGFHILPWLIYRREKLDFSTQRTLIPGKKEIVVRHDEDPLLPGQVRAVRMIHPTMENAWFFKRLDDGSFDETMLPFKGLGLDRDALEAMKKDALQAMRVSEIIGFVEWNIGFDDSEEMGKRDKAEALYFFVKVVGSMDRIHERLDNTFRSSLQDWMGKITFQHATEAKNFIEGLVHKAIERAIGELNKKTTDSQGRVRSWGINASSTRITEFNAGRDVSKALANETSSISALNHSRNVSAGKAFEIEAVEGARTNALKARAALLETEGGIKAAQLDVAKETLGKAGTIVVPAELGHISGLGALAGKLLSPQK